MQGMFHGKSRIIRPKAGPEQACKAEMSRHILPGEEADG